MADVLAEDEQQERARGLEEAARLRTLEDENRRLKKLSAESMLDVSALKDVLVRN